MAKKQTTKKRNPNDTTFRNLNALKRRVAALEIRTAIEEARVDVLTGWVKTLQQDHEMRRRSGQFNRTPR